MKITKNFECCGPTCHPLYIPEEANNPTLATINICTAISEDGGNIYKLPSGWKVVDKEPWCPRCCETLEN